MYSKMTAWKLYFELRAIPFKKQEVVGDEILPIFETPMYKK